MSVYSAWAERMMAEAQLGEPVGTNQAGAASSTQVAGSHYKDMAIQPAEYNTRNKIGFLQGNAIKYISRAGRKGPARQDIEKAIHCLQLLLEYGYEDPGAVSDRGISRVGG